MDPTAEGFDDPSSLFTLVIESCRPVGLPFHPSKCRERPGPHGAGIGNDGRHRQVPADTHAISPAEDFFRRPAGLAGRGGAVDADGLCRAVSSAVDRLRPLPEREQSRDALHGCSRLLAAMLTDDSSFEATRALCERPQDVAVESKRSSVGESVRVRPLVIYVTKKQEKGER